MHHDLTSQLMPLHGAEGPPPDPLVRRSVMFATSVDGRPMTIRFPSLAAAGLWLIGHGELA